MQITKQDNYTLVTSDTDIFNDFLLNFDKHYSELKNQHLIIDLSFINDNTPENVNKLKPWMTKSKLNNKSFIIITQNINIDLVLDDMICTPTM